MTVRYLVVSGQAAIAGMLGEVDIALVSRPWQPIPMKIDAQNYEEMKAWFAVMFSRAFRPELANPDTDPVARLEQIERGSQSKARAGLAMAIGDIIEMTEAWPIDRVTETDRALQANQLPTLSEARILFSKSIRRVLKRGMIKNDVEYYAVRNAAELAHQGDEEMWSLLAAYEGRQKP